MIFDKRINTNKIDKFDNKNMEGFFIKLLGNLLRF